MSISPVSAISPRSRTTVAAVLPPAASAPAVARLRLRRRTPGAGRTSIGGGSGATCWLTTGAFAPAAPLQPADADADPGLRRRPAWIATGRNIGNRLGRTRLHPVCRPAVRLPAAELSRQRRRRLAALDQIEPAGFAIDRPHRQPRRQRRHVDGAIERVGRARREQLDFRTAGRRSAAVNASLARMSAWSAGIS